jgi:hypothetical protein
MPQPSTPTNTDPDGEDPRGESRGSLGDGTAVAQGFNVEALDPWEEDLQQSGRSRGTGVVGTTSEIQWLHALLQANQLDDNVRHRSYTAPNSDQVSLITYYLENTANLDYAVDPYHVPPLVTAKQQLAVYMEKVHDSFPILSRKLFEDKCERYFQSVEHGIAPRLSPKLAPDTRILPARIETKMEASIWFTMLALADSDGMK